MTHMTPDQARKYLKRYADEEIPDRIAHRALETIAAEQIEYGMEYTFSEGAVETYWPHPSAATVDQVKVLDDVFGVPPRIAAMHEDETITRKRLMAHRVSAPWEVEQ